MMKKPLHALDPRAIHNAHQRAASTYEEAAVVDRWVADRLFERLDIIRFEPKRILDVGVRTGYTTMRLSKRYPEAAVFGVDLSFDLIKQSPQEWGMAVGDYTSLPFQSHSMDFIFSSLALSWSS